MADRYAGKPFLRLLDAFVLDSIDALTPEQKTALAGIEPKLQEAYKLPDRSWIEIVASVMKFPPDIRQRIMAAWMNAIKTAKKKGISFTAEEFTVQFVDALIQAGARQK